MTAQRDAATAKLAEAVRAHQEEVKELKESVTTIRQQHSQALKQTRDDYEAQIKQLSEKHKAKLTQVKVRLV